MVIAEEAVKRGWTHGAELGLWDGRTLRYLLEHVPSLTMIGVDIFRDIGIPDYRDGAWDHAGNREACRAIEAEYGSRVRVMDMLTVQAAEDVPNGSLDFVFIDADHSRTAVEADISAWRPKLKPNGVMMGHDIDWPSVHDAVTACYPSVQIRADNVWMAA